MVLPSRIRHVVFLVIFQKENTAKHPRLRMLPIEVGGLYKSRSSRIWHKNVKKLWRRDNCVISEKKKKPETNKE